MSRILVVGAGVGAGIAQQLIGLLDAHEIACELVEPNQFAIQMRQEIFDLNVAKLDDVRPHNWYQKFAGKRGKTPRY